MLAPAASQWPAITDSSSLTGAISMPTIGFGDISDFLGAFADLFGFLDFISGSVEGLSAE
ncbi:hypothetical protein RE2895_40420 [Rhodococcus erythropolis]|nr:hypothetical protein RHOER0001_6714 [Rhodococcus erythropolis SK121]BBE47111.1 hypothetical protein RE2895_40420 [Rhodococcus erythropolis]